MKNLLKDKYLTETDLRQGDIIFTGMGSFAQGHSGTLRDSYLTAADFGHAVLYVGNGQVVKEGWQRKSSLQDVLLEVGYALVFRPGYLQEQGIQSVCQHAGQRGQQDYADLNAFNSWRHHPHSLRYAPKHTARQPAIGRIRQVADIFSPLYSWQNDFNTAFQRCNLKCVGQLKGKKHIAEEKKKDVFSSPRKAGIFAYSKIEEIPPQKKTIAPLPPRQKEPIEKVGAAQAATLQEAAKNGTPFCEP